jgi:hypothetical protein
MKAKYAKFLSKQYTDITNSLDKTKRDLYIDVYPQILVNCRAGLFRVPFHYGISDECKNKLADDNFLVVSHKYKVLTEIFWEDETNQ